ncbi:MAG: hypothetical protein Q4G40_08595, partial [Brachybacterium sp.]|nr:hypothetical protein [Brachybacterium sp.]
MNVPRPGTQFLLPLTERTGDVVTVRVLADVDRDLVPHLPHGVRSPVEVVAGAVLVEVHQDGRPLLPGAWVEARALSSDLLRAAGVEPVLAGDIQMPAVVLGQGTEAV